MPSAAPDQSRYTLSKPQNCPTVGVRLKQVIFTQKILKKTIERGIAAVIVSLRP